MPATPQPSSADGDRIQAQAQSQSQDQDRTQPITAMRVVGGRYALRRRIGAGGTAEVFLADDTRLGRAVAVKLLAGPHAADPEWRDRFAREARAAGSLSHPNLVTIYDWGVDDDATPFLVMECIEGPTLRERLRADGPLPEAEALRLGAEIAAALGAAHAQGIVHRDVKPHNVLLDAAGHARVADFGIAHSSGTSSATTAMSVLGTVHYLAPERVEGRPADARSDLYSLGVLLYEALTGQPPYSGSTAVAIALQHVHGTPPSLRAARPDLAPETVAVVERALARDPAQRFASADEMVAALDAARAAAGRPRSARPRTGVAWLPALRGLRLPLAAGALRASRARMGLAALALALLLGSVALGASLQQGLTPTGGRPALAAVTATVPALAGRPLAEARAAASAAGLKVEVAEEPTLETPAGVVVTQTPAAGERVGPSATVRLLVSSGVRVPNIVGRQCADAATELAARGWSVRPVRWRIADVQDFGKVVQQEPAGNAVAPQPGPISVHVAGPVRPCEPTGGARVAPTPTSAPTPAVRQSSSSGASRKAEPPRKRDRDDDKDEKEEKDD